MKTGDLSKEEQKFLRTYQKRKLHYFRDMLRFAAILKKLTND